MNEAFEGHSEQEGENFPLFHSQEVKESVPHQWQDPFGERQKVELDPPRQIPNRSYSLQPDMAGGWRPRRSHKTNFSNVFSINYNSDIVDAIVKELYKAKGKDKDKLVYLGPRRNNSYLLHEERSYPNPYPIDKKVGEIFSGRNGMPHHPKVQTSMLTFDSDFESGNLDAAVERGPCGFDLFMRVDSNTRGHTNWFYFSVSNSDFIGTARFSICNFRRQKSLYQRGLKPYVFSRELDSDWRQGGKNVSYERQRPRYAFLYEDQEYEEYIQDQTPI